jgi:hypothetical protein
VGVMGPMMRTSNFTEMLIEVADGLLLGVELALLERDAEEQQEQQDRCVERSMMRMQARIEELAEDMHDRREAQVWPRKTRALRSVLKMWPNARAALRMIARGSGSGGCGCEEAGSGSGFDVAGGGPVEADRDAEPAVGQHGD